MDKQRAKEINALLDEALAAFAAKHGLVSAKGTRTVFDRGGNMTVSVDIVDAGGIDKEASLYDSNRQMFGLPERGTKFARPRGPMTISGMTKGGKVIAAAPDGKMYVFDAAQLAAILKAQNGAANDRP